MRSLLAFGLIFALALTVGACQDAAEEAEMTMCEALDAFGEALVAAQDGDALNTMEDVDAAMEGVTTAWTDVTANVGGLEEVGLEAVDAAYSELDAAATDMSEDATVDEAKAELMPLLESVQTAYDEFYAANCPEGGEIQ